MTDNKLNRLERSIVQSEDSAEDDRWAQAEEVVRRLENETERQVAASWINGRTKKPYRREHVARCKRLWELHGVTEPSQRPRWLDAYEDVKGATNTRTDRAEAQAPRSIETAEKLVENLIKASDEIFETVYYGLKEVVQAEPIEREKTEKTFTQKFSDAAFRIWKLHDELQDAVPDPAEAERLRTISQVTLDLCQSLLRSLDRGQPVSIDDELQKMIEEARSEQQASS